MPNTYRSWLALLLAGGLLLQVATLTAYPPPHCDETYYADTALALLTQGRFGTPVHGPVYALDENHTVIGRLYATGLAGVLAALGVSLTSARLYSLLGWLAAVGGVYVLGRRLYGRRSAFWAALLFAVSFKTFFAAHLARPEIWLAAGVLWVFAALATPGRAGPARPTGRGRAALMGVAAALLADIHFIGAFFLVGLSLVALYRWLYLPLRAGQTPITSHQLPNALLNRPHWDMLLAFFAGAGLGLALWAALHFLPDPASAWHQWSVGHTRLGMGAGSRAPWAALADLLPWLADGFLFGNRGLNALEGLLFAAGVGFALARRARGDILLLLVLAGSMLTYGALFAQKLSNYRVLWTPLFWLLAVEAVTAGLGWVRARLDARGGPATAWLRPALPFLPLVALYLFSAGWLVRQFRGGQLAETTRALRALIPPGATVLGDPIWWFDFQADNAYFGDLYLTYYASAVSPPAGAVPVRQQLTQAQVHAALQQIDVEYVILDERLHCLQDEDYQPFYALREYVAGRCELLGEVAGGWYGQPWAVTYPLGELSEVYRCA